MNNASAAEIRLAAARLSGRTETFDMGSKMSFGRGSSDQEFTSETPLPHSFLHSSSDCKQLPSDKICAEDTRLEGEMKETSQNQLAPESNSSGLSMSDGQVTSESAGRRRCEQSEEVSSQVGMSTSSQLASAPACSSTTDNDGQPVQVRRKRGRPRKVKPLLDRGQKAPDAAGLDIVQHKEVSTTIPLPESFTNSSRDEEVSNTIPLPLPESFTNSSRDEEVSNTIPLPLPESFTNSSRDEEVSNTIPLPLPESFTNSSRDEEVSNTIPLPLPESFTNSSRDEEVSNTIPLPESFTNSSRDDVPNAVDGHSTSASSQNETPNDEAGVAVTLVAKRKRGRPKKSEAAALKVAAAPAIPPRAVGNPVWCLRSRGDAQTSTQSEISQGKDDPGSRDAAPTESSNTPDNHGLRRRRRRENNQQVPEKVPKLDDSQEAPAALSEGIEFEGETKADKLVEPSSGTPPTEMDENSDKLSPRSKEVQEQQLTEDPLPQSKALSEPEPEVTPSEDVNSLKMVEPTQTDETQSASNSPESLNPPANEDLPRTEPSSTNAVTSSKETPESVGSLDILKTESVEINLDSFNSLSQSDNNESSLNTTVKSADSVTGHLIFRRKKGGKRRRFVSVALPRHRQVEKQDPNTELKMDCGDAQQEDVHVSPNLIYVKKGTKTLLKCGDCSRTYKFLSQLIVHQRLHTGERPFVCQECGKGFSKNSNLNLHLKMHTKNTVYENCPVCTARVFRSEYNHHMQVHSLEEEVKNTTPEKPSNVVDLEDGQEVHNAPPAEKAEKIGETAEKVEKIGETAEKTEEVEKIEETAEKVEKIEETAEKVEKIIKMAEKTEKVEKIIKMAEKTEEVEKIEETAENTEKVEKIIKMAEKVEKIIKMAEKTEKVEKIIKMAEKVEKIIKMAEKTEKVEKIIKTAEKTEKVEKIIKMAEKVEKIIKMAEKTEKVEKIIKTAEKTEKVEKIEETAEKTEKVEKIIKMAEKTEKVEKIEKMAEKTEKMKNKVCQYCGKSFLFQSALTRHVRVHTGEKPYNCDICGKAFGQSYFLRVHELTHWSVKRYTCTRCEKSFGHYSNARKHRCKPVEGGDESHPTRPSLTYTCHICKKVFEHLQEFNSHMKEHTGARLLRCLCCDKLFTGITEFDEHRSWCSADKNTSSAFSNREDTMLVIRYKVPSGNTLSGPNSASVAASDHKLKKKPTQVTSRKRPANVKNTHQLTVAPPHDLSALVSRLNQLDSRSDPRKYLCPSCGRQFRHMGRLRAHMLTHAPDQSYTCALCGKTLRSWNELWRHQRVHRRRGGRFTCPQCDRGFRFVGPYRKHMKEHPEFRWIEGRPRKVIDPYQCEECSCSFKTLDLLFTHQLSHSTAQVLRRDSDLDLPVDRHSLQSSSKTSSPPSSNSPQSSSHKTPDFICQKVTLVPLISFVSTSQPHDVGNSTQQHPSKILSVQEKETERIKEITPGAPNKQVKPPTTKNTSKSKQGASDDLNCAVCGNTFPAISDLFHHYLQHARGQV